MSMSMQADSEVMIPSGDVTLRGELTIPPDAWGVVLFAHGSGSSRSSPRNLRVAHRLHEARLGTLLFDLLSHEEEVIDSFTRHFRFDIPLLAERLVDAAGWLAEVDAARDLPLGIYGASTGSAAALVAAAKLGKQIGAIVSRGGRPDLASAWLAKVESPTLLIVGDLDRRVLELNQEALVEMKAPCELYLIQGAHHLFDEPGALEKVGEETVRWFQRWWR